MSEHSNLMTLEPDGTLRIPEEVRKKLGWEPGQRFAIVPSDGVKMLVPVPEAEDLFGRMKGADPEGYRDRNDRY